MTDFDQIYNELAQRAIIPEIADESTILVKLSSPGRLYEARTIQDFIPGATETYQSETFTLTETDIANKFITVAYEPLDSAEIGFEIQNAPSQYYGEDYKQDTSFSKRITWEGLALDGVIQAGDKVTVTYIRGTFNG